MDPLFTIHPLDNVAVSRDSRKRGETLGSITLLDDILSGHKEALRSISAGNWVWKEGVTL